MGRVTRQMTGQALNTKHRVLLRPIESHDGIPALLRPQWTQFEPPEALSYCRHAPLDDARESKGEMSNEFRLKVKEAGQG